MIPQERFDLIDAREESCIDPNARLNPTGEAWLSILHTKRGPWRLTALYSNTPNAHRLDRTRDWVVVYFEKDGTAEGQCTVVTETRGPFKGRRVVRGHEPHRFVKRH